MEENIYNDKLDDYVRKSFDEYSEDPSGNMWERIEVDLPATPPVMPAVRPRLLHAIRWQLAAAAVIGLLLTGLVCEHFYYDGKIKALTAEKDPQMQTTRPLNKGYENASRTNAEQPSNPANQMEKIEPEIGPHHPAHSASASSNKPGADVKNQSVEREIVDKNGKIDKLQRKNVFSRKPKTQSVEVATGSRRLNKHNGSPDKRREPVLLKNESDAAALLPPAGRPASGNAIPVANPAIAAADKTLDVEAPASGAPAAAGIQKISAFEALPGRFVTIENTLNPGTIPTAQPIQPAKLLSGWYVSVQAAPQYTFSSKPEAPPRSKPGLPFVKPAFVHREEETVQNTDVWVKTGKKIGTNFAFETGLGYRGLTRTAEHKADFEFREGKHSPGGPGSGKPSWSVSYSLNTYGGAASVELRADQADAGAVKDDEKLDFSIQTKQHLQMLRVPMLAVAKIGRGRTLGILKAGLVGNFVVKNELTITGTSLNNTRFTPDNKGGRSKSPFEKRKSFIPGYWASAGLEYRLSRKFSISAEPFVSGDFAQNTFGKHRLPSYYSAGVNAGVQYNF